jgi:hypothetical protein
VQLHNGEVVVHAGSQRMTVHMPTVSALVVRCPGVKKDTRANLWGPILDPQADREENWWAPQPMPRWTIPARFASRASWPAATA